jgi:hypothetical protein
MMLLGLVLHSAISYGVLDYGDAWSLEDPEATSPLFDLMVGYIHAFRMPVFLAKAGLADVSGDVARMALNAIIVWCFVFGITGLFVRYCSGHWVPMRFVSDASYWFYLVHLPLTALGAGLLIGSGLPAGIKFLLVLAGTTVVCWVTYSYAVRSTFVGRFLNGRRYPRTLLPLARRHGAT